MDPLLLPHVNTSVKTLEDDDDDDDDLEQVSIPLPPPGNEKWNLRIKSIKDVTIQVLPTDSIRDVKEAVRRALGTEVTQQRPYTRLVCKGRLLAPDAARLQDLSVVQPDDVVHAVLSASAPKEGPQAALQRGLSGDDPATSQTTTTSSSTTLPSRRPLPHERINVSTGPSRRAWRGAGINAAGLAVRQTADSDDDSENNDDDDDDENSVQDVEHAVWLGFDRLRRAGLRRADVTALRTYFNRHIDRFVRQNPEQTAFANETDARRRRLLQEDLWMAHQGPLSEFRLNLNPNGASNNNNNSSNTPLPPGWNAARGGGGLSSPSEAIWRSGGISAQIGTDRDFVWGFLLGFLVGLLMLVWVWLPSVPHKQKLGILTGICFQLAFSMLRTSGGVDEYPVDEGDDFY